MKDMNIIDRINKLREDLNELVEIKADFSVIFDKSREIDNLIIIYYEMDKDELLQCNAY